MLWELLHFCAVLSLFSAPVFLLGTVAGRWDGQANAVWFVVGAGGVGTFFLKQVYEVAGAAGSLAAAVWGFHLLVAGYTLEKGRAPREARSREQRP